MPSLRTATLFTSLIFSVAAVGATTTVRGVDGIVGDDFDTPCQLEASGGTA
jgi:hypothetical protein